MRNRKTVAEFFAGIGLMRLGLEEAGWNILIANDIDPLKRKFYEDNFNGDDYHFILEDIHNLTSTQIPSAILATASFPCTDLSLAGRRAGLDGRHSSAFWGFVNIIKGLGAGKPPLILLENVTGFLTSNNGKDFENALLALNALGYAVDAFIVNAAHFVPQSRVRLFIIGKLSELSHIESQVNLFESELRPMKLLAFINSHPKINWSIRTDLPKFPKLKTTLKAIVEDLPKDSALWFNRERTAYFLNQTFDRHKSKIIEQKKKPHYEYYTAFRRVRNGKSMAEVRFDGIAGCLRTPKGGSARQMLLEVGKGEINIRLLTPRECARLMGAKDFIISGTSNEALFGFGDAVCVPVVTWIAQNYLNSEYHKIKISQSLHKRNYVTTA